MGDLLGLLGPALVHQPARGLRKAEAGQEQDHRGHRAGAQDDPPVQGERRGHHVAEGEGQHEPEVPGDLGERHQLAALAGRGELGEQRPADGVVGADRDPHQEAYGEQLPGRVDEELEERADHEHREVERESGLAAELVGEPAAERPADEDADEGGRPDQALPEQGHVQLGGGGTDGRADDAEDVSVDEHATDDHRGHPDHESLFVDRRPGALRSRRSGLGSAGEGHTSVLPEVSGAGLLAWMTATRCADGGVSTLGVAVVRGEVVLVRGRGHGRAHWSGTVGRSAREERVR
ncbi:hypothetical protein RCO28_15925 [Streptomyces sp. LHD-70]|nr:hypothetical protein [Streptomyces sp. LHD-70]MDQ8703970.1 hypothetical protein [Streptomyces sp. LHD-70]